MPRLKTVSQKITDTRRRQLSWNLVDKQFEQPQLESDPFCTSNSQDDSAKTLDTDTKSLLPPKKKRRKSKQNYMELLPFELQELVSQHNYYISIKRKKAVELDQVVCLLGHIDIILQHTTAPYNLPDYPEFWLYVNEVDVTKSFLYFEKWDYTADDAITVNYFLIEKLPPLYLMSGLHVKQYFVICLDSFDPIERTVRFGILLKTKALTQLRFPSDAPRLKPNLPIQATIQYLYGISPADYSALKRVRKHDINALYSAIKEVHSKVELKRIEVQHGNLLPQLRPYQIDAIIWMLNQERRSCIPNDGDVHQLYQPIESRDKKIMFYNRYGGYLVREKPRPAAPKPGGILADEMGLGKTVEVLACVLNNPRKNTIPMLGNSDVEEMEIEAMEGIESGSASSSNAEAGMNSTRQADVEVALHLKSRMLFDESSTSSSIESHFSCICGQFEGFLGAKGQVQCCECGLWQHKKCVRYDKTIGQFYCMHCRVAMKPISSRATLIVCPASIHRQWRNEIKRHVEKDALKVFNYSGVFKFGFIQPPKLADFDIVLTTYEILRRELHYVDLPHTNSDVGRRLRNPKRFTPIPSPLIAIEWWRICLDEAQMVETVTTRTADMALRLCAVNRWCITGTPIQKSVEDLYGLLLFLGTDPYSVKTWWRECLYEPYCHGETEPMNRVISQILWRTAKADVLDQIGLPEQTEEIHYMRFTPVEEYFYRQQHIDCSREALVRLNNMPDWDTKLSSLDRKSLANLLAPVLRLRQACCHPQAVKGQFISVHKNTLTMEELLVQLIKKTKNEAEEAHRQNIAALNGLAAVFIIQEQWVEAAEKYRDVLRIASEEIENLKTDKMQRLHALQNLAELLEAGHQNIPPTLRDSSLRSEADEVRRSYLTKCLAKVMHAQEMLRGVQETCLEVEQQLDTSRNCWWIEAMFILERRNLGDELLERIRADLLETSHPKKSSIVNQFRSINGLKLVLTTQMGSLKVAHDVLVKAVLQLDLKPNQDEVNAAVECHLRPTSNKPIKCIYCRIHDLFNRFEGKLFFFTDDEERSAIEPTNSEEALMTQLRRGTWADNEVEKIFKTIFSFAKNHCAYTGLEDVPLDIKLFEVYKKEFRALRGVWMQIRDYVSAIDELNMATIRLRLRLPDEPKPDPPQPNILESNEIKLHRFRLQADGFLSANEKKKKLGQLLYLKNLAKSDLGKGRGNNPEPCPICQKTLGEQWSVMQCGHCFCVECIQVLVSHSVCRGRTKTVKCAICRQTMTPTEISYINTTDENDETDEIKVQGSYSTKIEQIIRTLLLIKDRDPTAKALVFSTWTDVLDVLAKALYENNIKFSHLMSNVKYQNNLEKFKTDPRISVLLLPVQTGANGLNLIEATHVLLVEPILNPASELQAVGRIHRIGQDRETFVHRFLVRNTIEERMYSMLKTYCTKASSHETEENMLTINDLRNLFEDESS